MRSSKYFFNFDITYEEKVVLEEEVKDGTNSTSSTNSTIGAATSNSTEPSDAEATAGEEDAQKGEV